MTAPREEIGPWLGVVASPRPRPAPGGVSLDTARLALVDRLLRTGHDGPEAWLAAWAEAVREAEARTRAAIEAAAAAAEARSLAPERVAARARPGDDDLAMIAARLESAGIPLEDAAARGATGGASLARLGGALEEAWLALERTVEAVLAEWRPRAREVEAWRRPRAGLWVASAVVVGAALVAGLMIGGYLPAPRWLQPFTDWWWSLPWP